MSQRSASIPNAACRVLVALLCLVLLAPGLAQAKGKRSVRKQRAQQQSQLERQERLLAEQQRVIEKQQRMLERQEELLSSMLESSSASDAELSERVGRGEIGPVQPASEAPVAAALVAHKDKVGKAPEERGAPEVTALADVGGVLTPRGRLVLEPQQQLGSTSINRFSFNGLGVADQVLIGQVDASEADRDTMTTSLSARYGITNRFEVDTRIPFVMRSDTVTRRIVSQTQPNTESDQLKASGLGDIEFGMKYQLNQGESGWPFLIGNLRVKTRTGSDPFAVARDRQGLASELSTGSGFWTVSPSITAISYSDPAVFFGNLSYNWNVSNSVDERITGRDDAGGITQLAHIGRVNPGNSIGASFGMSLALNERTSFNLGYDHQFVTSGTTEVTGCLMDTPEVLNEDGTVKQAFKAANPCKRTLSTDSLQIGSFMFGLSYSGAKGNAYSLLLTVGATEDAPDVSLTFRAPFNFDLF